MLTLLFAIHNHQPDGNFGHVFQQAYDDCYRPLVDALIEAPHVTVALHHTGPLLEWIERERPEYFDKMRVLVERGQAELLGGGFYEPMLAVLPERDARGQIEMMSSWLHSHFGVRPRGMWLAERVWEPALAKLIADCGIRYTLVDDGHFRAAGMGGPLRGYYVTEKAGTPLALFPIDKTLRESIPFSLVPDCMQGLGKIDVETPAGLPSAATYGDDGEKFGVWPKTKAWVWDKGWLRDFFAQLRERADLVRTQTFSQFLDENPPSGRVYLPTASYEEMGEWALPPDAQARYLAIRERLAARGEFEEARAFLRGGIWQGFFARYGEANTMHKKMIAVSDQLARAEARSGPLDEARRQLYRAQCNCSYWHGLFGGLYLNYLRDTVYHRLIDAEMAAENALDLPTPRVEVGDLDGDLRDEARLVSSQVAAYIELDEGGAVYELDFRPKRFNVLNVLSRRPEGYHKKLASAAHADHSSDGVQSIHDLTVVKHAGLADLLVYDTHPRHAFIDGFYAPDVSPDDLAAGRAVERSDFAGARYTLVGRDETSVKLRRAGRIDGRPAVVEKTITLDGASLSCRWHVSAGGPPFAVTFAPEIALTLLAGDAQDRYYRADAPLDDRRLASRGEIRASSVELVNEWDSFFIRVTAAPATHLIRFPIETASQSESGFERTYQGSVLLAPFRSIELGDGRWLDCSVTIDLVDTYHA